MPAPSSQTMKSLRVYAALAPPAAFSGTDDESFVPYVDWTITGSTDPFTNQPKANQNAQSQGMKMIVVGGSGIDFSFDGTTIHGTVLAADGQVTFLGSRERAIYFQQHDSGTGATVRFWAW